MNSLGFDEKRVLRHALDISDLWLLAGRVRLEFPRFLKTLRALQGKKLITTGRGTVHLTGRGRRETRRNCLQSKRSMTARLRTARKIFTSVARRRPTSSGRYNQGYMTTDSVFNRVRAITGMGDAAGKAIAILGDDDLLSVAICLAARPESVTVLEIDPRIVGFVTETAEDLQLPIKAQCRDLRRRLPSSLMGRFDTFVTDPSETIGGLRMFLGRGLGLLKAGEGRAGYFGLTSIEASARKWREIQRWLISRYSLAITHILPENAYYSNWPDLLDQTSVFSMECLKARPKREWFNSSLFRLETLSDFKPRHAGRVKGPIFDDEEACGEIGELVG